MNKLSKLIVILLMSTICFGQKKANFEPTFTKSKETTHNIPKGQEYTFGYLEVLENRNDPNSQTIQIPVYIFKSRNARPKTDPIIYTVGGPGSTTMPSAQYMNYYKYLDDRDFILLEQRGNFYAKPHLDCPEWSKALSTSNLPDFDSKKSDSLFAAAAQSCRERLVNKGIDLEGYTTNEIAADINDLVNVLNIKEYNLLTISYSTKIAQVLLRDYPERIRSVVMDSPLPLEVNYDEESVKNLLESVDKLLSDCEAHKECIGAFPNIKKRFFDYLTEKTKDPLEVTIENPQSGQVETFYLTGADLITVFTSASTGDVVHIPLEINKLFNNDMTSVKERLSYVFREPGNGAGVGMRLSVWCAEENPFSSKETIDAETTKYPQVEGLSPSVFANEICKIWSVKKVSEIENKAVSSAIPVLLISGEYDNETPVKWAESMKDNLTNSYHLIFRGWKHTPTTNWGNQCAMQAANDFFNNPNTKPNPDCIAQIESPEFKTE
ncbi:alpha/beta hydrolase [Flavobacteriaceae bacterium TP-CH-4]|uniref:Alpha/beta hydrolase n=1 Tax=Pelagihabitans pacificus TaxID=2696054 RepID=A0A967AYE9_9FLAO|nr:alpha/beta fold hydrolase [Pelagihabitans pacificus]NHF61405.1 alpha/beta hydrolase [Pelagihabitans pacificus]